MPLRRLRRHCRSCRKWVNALFNVQGCVLHYWLEITRDLSCHPSMALCAENQIPLPAQASTRLHGSRGSRAIVGRGYDSGWSAARQRNTVSFGASVALSECLLMKFVAVTVLLFPVESLLFSITTPSRRQYMEQNSWQCLLTSLSKFFFFYHFSFFASVE